MTEQEVLATQSVDELQGLRTEDFADRDLTEEEFRHIFEIRGAFWMHSGDPEAPHAELTSGLCSNGYINCSEALCYTNICEIMACQAVRCLKRFYNWSVDWVIGSSYAAIDFSHDVARRLGAKHGYTEKDDKEQIWKRWVIAEDEIVLQAEELMTTSRTALAVREGIRKSNPNPVQFALVMLVLVHRSDVNEIEDSSVIPVFHFDIHNWEPDVCPLCKAGSKRLRPKQNWAELTKTL